MDLSKVTKKGAFDVATTMTLLHVHDLQPILGFDGEPVTFQVHSLQSKVARDIMASNEAKAKSEDNPNGLDEEQRGIELACAIIAGWSDNFGIDGETKLKFNKSNLKKLITEQDWIGTQALNYSSKNEKYRPKFETH